MSLSNEFINAVGQLKQYPGSNLIGAIIEATRKEGDSNATLVTNYLVKRMLNVPTSYKVPLVYALDAIVKKFRGTYITELSNNLGTFFIVCFRDIDDKDKLRLRGVLRSWQKQNILPPNVTNPLYNFVQDWINKNPDRVAIAQGKKKPHANTSAVNATGAAVNLKPVGIDMSAMQFQQGQQQQFQSQRMPVQQQFQFQPMPQQQPPMPVMVNPNQFMRPGMPRMPSMPPQFVQQQHSQVNYGGITQQPRFHNNNNGNMPTITQPIQPLPNPNMTNITNANSNQAEDLLNMIGGENTQNDGASSLKGQNDNNGNSNGDALASVLGFLNQMANEGAKPKVPKVPLKDVFGVPNFIQHVNRRNEHIVEKLYGKFPYFCKTSGARLATEEEYNAHLDWVFKKKMKSTAGNSDKDNDKIVSRPWYLNHKEWLSLRSSGLKDNNGDGAVDDGLALVNAMLSKTTENQKVIADDNFKICPISKEKFELVYDEEIENWIYKDAIQPDGPGTTIFSKHCYTKEKANALKLKKETKKNIADESNNDEAEMVETDKDEVTKELEENIKEESVEAESIEEEEVDEVFTLAELMKMKKNQLIQLADKHGASNEGTKKVIANNILKSVKGNVSGKRKRSNDDENDIDGSGGSRMKRGKNN